MPMMMQASLMAGYFRNGTEPKPHGNKQPYATNSAYDAKLGMVMIGASNIRQQARFWQAVGREDMIKTDNEARVDHREAEAAVIADIIKTKTADEWEIYFQARHVPAARVRTTWRRRTPTRISRSGACSTISTRCRASTARSAYPWRRSNSPMAARRSNIRRTRWGRTPTPCSPSSATTRRPLQSCATRR